MRRLPFKNNLQIGSWYIGAGNKPSVISQKPARPFAKIREVYKDQLSHHYGSRDTPAPPLSEHDKNMIRKKMNQYYYRLFFIRLVTVILAIIITLSALWLIADFMKMRVEEIF